MRKFIEKTDRAGALHGVLTLPLEKRVRSRLRARLDSGEEIAILLPRGSVLHDGDRLCAESGELILVRAAPEALSRVRSDDPLQLARACYHLGNRHMQVQILAGEVRYLHDHVIDEMLRGLGFSVSLCEAPFAPEPGAYGGSAEQAHAHGHSHAHPH